MDELLLPDPDLLTPGMTVGPYEIVARIGSGGFGVVYKVRRDGLYFALKFAKAKLSDMSADQRERHEARVRRESSILGLINHPNIVRVHYCERWPNARDGYLYLVMDLVNGLRLYEWRAKTSPSLRRICEVFKQIALALAEAHSRGAYHRDVKSENILVGPNGPVLIDWNIARTRAAAAVTEDHTALGTHSHFAPEYCRYLDDPAAETFNMTPATELHSVGYVFYEMLTGRSPFGFTDETTRDDNNKAIIRRLTRAIETITSLVPPPPSSINNHVPGSLDAIVGRLLEKEPSARFGAATDLAKALDDAMAVADASWDAPFDLPQPASSAKAGAAEKAKPPGRRSEPEILPALPAAAPAAVAAPLRERPLEAPEREDDFESPEFISPGGAGIQNGARPGAARDAVPPELAAAAARLGQRTDSPSAGWAARNKPLLFAAGVAMALVLASALLGRKAPAPKDTLLAKVQREQLAVTASTPPEKAPAVEPQATSLPPPPDLGGSRAAAPKRQLESRSASGARAPTRGGAAPEDRATFRGPPSDARQIDDELKAAYGRPRVAPIANQPKEEPKRPSGLLFGHRVATSDEGSGPARFGLQTGARLRAQLDINLDSRTVSGGPTIAKLVRSYISDSRVIFPAGTMLFGDARANGSRFSIRFTRLVLPTKREVPFEGLAYDPADRKPGLAPGRRIANTQQREGTGERIGKVVGSTMLSKVGGGLAEDAARRAGEVVLNAPPETMTSGGDALLLDAGADLDVLVTKPF